MDGNTEYVEKTRAALRFIGDLINPDIITQKLGIIPTNAHKKGDISPIRAVLRHPTGLWIINSHVPDNSLLADHLASLLSLLDRTAPTPGAACYTAFATGKCREVSG